MKGWNTMRRSEMNGNQLTAFEQVINAIDWLTGDYENMLMDGIITEDEIPSHEELMEDTYNMVLNCRTYAGMQKDGGLDEVRFCGKDWIMERIDKRLKKLGY